MWTTEQIQNTLKTHFPDADVAVDDLTGTSNHFQVTIVTDAFENKSMIESHRMVYDALGEDVGGAIHALSIKSYTKAKWAARSTT